jgi:diaminohydroxyphosphoribosylaminopyrimidine deaminase/5-amino-6-(5-phosphoribosylamino)uracil reductase
MGEGSGSSCDARVTRAARAFPARSQPEEALVRRGTRVSVGSHRPQDEQLMLRALALAEGARRLTPPWPWVGCVIVRDGAVVGEGATGPFRVGVHAEAAALAEAGDAARGATAYVTLEPCSHHGNTPPCADALIAAGITRVVVAMGDPDERVAGRGLSRLRDAGVEVVTGVGAAQVGPALMPYLQHRRTGRAYSVLKCATSLDGRIAARDGSSRWITGAQARADVHRLRAESQAIVVGAGTALADDPALTVRDAPAPPRPPLRVLLDASGRVPASGPLFDADLGPTLVCTSEAADPRARDGWLAAGAKVENLPASTTGIEPVAVLECLGREGVLQALVEGGAPVHGSFLAADAVDRVVAYVAPLLLGRDGRPGWGIEGPSTIDDAPRWRLVDTTRLGDDVRLTLVPAGQEDRDATPGRSVR